MTDRRAPWKKQRPSIFHGKKDRKNLYRKQSSVSSIESMMMSSPTHHRHNASRKTLLGLFIRALFPRLLFLIHGLLCVYIIVKQENDNKYWYLTICLGLLFLEGIFNVIVRHGKEFHWFCPSAFLYCAVLIVTLTLLREAQIKCLDDNMICNSKVGDAQTTCLAEKASCDSKLPGSDFIINFFNGMSFSKRADMIEQTGLLVLIVGRWLLPQGSISKDQFCQILLIYIGTAADIVEFSEIYKDDDVINLGPDTVDVLRSCCYVWAFSVLQFSMTIALPEDGLKEEEEDDEEEENQFEQMSYFRTAKLQNKVAPMSYMQYKSMLREGMNNGSDEGFQLTARRNHQNTRSGTFQEKYPTLGVENAANKFRSKPAGLTPLALASTSPRGKSSESNGVNNTQQSQSNGSLSQRSQTWSTPRQKKISLPRGGRVPTNIGSPPLTERSIGSPMSVRSKKTSVTSRPAMNETARPTSKGSSTESTNSEPKNFSTGSKSPPIKTWDRLLERIPWSNKRKRRENMDFQGLQRKDSTKEDNSLGIGKKEVKGCFYKYLDLIAILLPVCMQDGPFFILRFVLIAHYNVITGMLPILLTKNALVIIVNIYRILILYCSEPPKEQTELDDPSTRVRAAMDTNQKLSNRASLRAKRASIAVQALTRMQTQLLGREDASVLRQTRQDEINRQYDDSPA
uniref:Transmembrane protein 26 n=2 Tax=Clytia hemisphaerica TaxID=252671 RepID=A0A7M6DP29_9CNID